MALVSLISLSFLLLRSRASYSISIFPGLISLDYKIATRKRCVLSDRMAYSRYYWISQGSHHLIENSGLTVLCPRMMLKGDHMDCLTSTSYVDLSLGSRRILFSTS